jgi:hypothetical protein
MGGFVVKESAFGQPQTVIPFSHRVVACGVHTCIANAVQTITVAGVLATDLAFAQFQTSTGSRYVKTVLPSADTLTVTCSGDPTVAGRLSYLVLRAC